MVSCGLGTSASRLFASLYPAREGPSAGYGGYPALGRAGTLAPPPPAWVEPLAQI